MRKQISAKEISRQNITSHHSPAQGPDSNIIGGNLDNGGQEKVQIHVSTKRWSAERYTVINHGVYKPVEKSSIFSYLSM